MRTFYAVEALRVSSTKQGLIGDSPEDQQNQIRLKAKNLEEELGCKIIFRKTFEFQESASGDFETQPVLKAITYCGDPSNDISFLFIKCIDRFTRGGAEAYLALKNVLTQAKVQMINAAGLISNKEVNTLQHLDISYKWSLYNPSKKAEILEAEDSKDEVRKILTRLIGAEINYVRMGYRVRQPPAGYQNTKIDTDHGKRVILTPHPIEAPWFIRMFELRAQHIPDQKIVKEINGMGYKSRRMSRHSKENYAKITGHYGEIPLTIKQLQKIIAKPIYAGISIEKWLNGHPVKTRFKGLVSISLYNQANHGKMTIIEEGDAVRIYKGKVPSWYAKRQDENPDYPYKKYVLCPQCNNSLHASAPKGRTKKYPMYHCGRKHHQYSVSIEDFMKTIHAYTDRIDLSDEEYLKFRKIILEEWEKRQTQAIEQSITANQTVQQLQEEARMITQKIKILNSPIAIHAMEDELEVVYKRMDIAKGTRTKIEKKEIDIQLLLNVVRHYLKHFNELLYGDKDPLQNAAMFGILFAEVPTYEDLKLGTAILEPLFKLKPNPEQLENSLCELAGSRVELIFASLIKTYYKLRELGFTEVNGKIVFLDDTEVKP